MSIMVNSEESAKSDRKPPTYLDLEKVHAEFVVMAASYTGCPRRRRIGGFVMSTTTAFAWASRIHGQTIYPVYENHLAEQTILQKIGKYKVDFRNVGEVPDVEWMVLTQVAPFRGWVGMDPAIIPQFVEGEREAIGRKLLAEEGVSSEHVRRLCDLNIS